ncbi:MAG: transporter, partial [Gammaproteobacteria bacterium]|nr:transporter [Gammaproteobacteria bacterium]
MNNNTFAPAIHILNARLRYANKLLFDQLSVTVEAAKFTCLLGPSGIGKTSFLRLITGLIAPQAHSQTELTGTVVASDAKPLANRIAYLAQSDSLLPWLTALENVVIGAKLRGSKPDLARAKYLLGQVGLENAMLLKPQELSGGMRQRVALARTLFENRPIVLMDEPFAALDTITRIKLQELAATLLENSTVLLVTHDPLEALRLGHHIYVMAGQPATLTVL